MKKKKKQHKVSPLQRCARLIAWIYQTIKKKSSHQFTWHLGGALEGHESTCPDYPLSLPAVGLVEKNRWIQYIKTLHGSQQEHGSTSQPHTLMAGAQNLLE